MSYIYNDNFPACLKGTFELNHIKNLNPIAASKLLPIYNTKIIDNIPYPMSSTTTTTTKQWIIMFITNTFIIMIIILLIIYYKQRKKILKQHQLDHQHALQGIKIVGKITIYTNEVLGTGSRGTVVFGGICDNRKVAIKRMVKQFYGTNDAEKEINLLIDSDNHANVLRYHAKEADSNFIYVALERCEYNLEYLIANNMLTSKQEIYQTLYQLIDGLCYLHSLNIVHRDLKPEKYLTKSIKTN